MQWFFIQYTKVYSDEHSVFTTPLKSEQTILQDSAYELIDWQIIGCFIRDATKPKRFGHSIEMICIQIVPFYC